MREYENTTWEAEHGIVLIVRFHAGSCVVVVPLLAQDASVK
jgi:hypothetical protein